MLNNLKLVFNLYGGWVALRSSSYFYFSIALSLFLWRSAYSEAWVKNATELLPPVIGFSVAALAIITAMGDEKFRKNMAQIDIIKPGESDLVVVVANFCWFVIVQVFAVIFAISYAAKPFPSACIFPQSCVSCNYWNSVVNVSASIFGQFMTIYSMLLMVAAVFQMLNVFRLYLRNI